MKRKRTILRENFPPQAGLAWASCHMNIYDLAAIDLKLTVAEEAVERARQHWMAMVDARNAVASWRLEAEARNKRRILGKNIYGENLNRGGEGWDNRRVRVSPRDPNAFDRDYYR